MKIFGTSWGEAIEMNKGGVIDEKKDANNNDEQK